MTTAAGRWSTSRCHASRDVSQFGSPGRTRLPSRALARAVKWSTGGAGRVIKSVMVIPFPWCGGASAGGSEEAAVLAVTAPSQPGHQVAHRSGGGGQHLRHDVVAGVALAHAEEEQTVPAPEGALADLRELGPLHLLDRRL